MGCLLSPSGIGAVVVSDHGGATRMDAGDDEFQILLPLVAEAATHVAELCGDEVRFMDALGVAVRSGGDEVAALFSPVAATSLGELADVLNGLGGVSVQSIDPVQDLDV
jgi:hypothetical protein